MPLFASYTAKAAAAPPLLLLVELMLAMVVMHIIAQRQQQRRSQYTARFWQRLNSYRFVGCLSPCEWKRSFVQNCSRAA